MCSSFPHPNVSKSLSLITFAKEPAAPVKTRLCFGVSIFWVLPFILPVLQISENKRVRHESDVDTTDRDQNHRQFSLQLWSAVEDMDLKKTDGRLWKKTTCRNDLRLDSGSTTPRCFCFLSGHFCRPALRIKPRFWWWRLVDCIHISLVERKLGPSKQIFADVIF